MNTQFLQNTVTLFEYYRSLGEKALAQVPEDKLTWMPSINSNSLAIMINHLAGNMLSRWTGFLTTDGEKAWRNRDAEFEDPSLNRNDLMKRWDEGWSCLFHALRGLNEGDLEKTVYIRNMGQPVHEAISRQLAHYSYHIGQIVFVSRMIVGEDWKSLSIAKGASASYNKEKFDSEKKNEHFTDDWTGKK